MKIFILLDNNLPDDSEEASSVTGDLDDEEGDQDQENSQVLNDLFIKRHPEDTKEDAVNSNTGELLFNCHLAIFFYFRPHHRIVCSACLLLLLLYSPGSPCYFSLLQTEK